MANASDKKLYDMIEVAFKQLVYCDEHGPRGKKEVQCYFYLQKLTRDHLTVR